MRFRISKAAARALKGLKTYRFGGAASKSKLGNKTVEIDNIKFQSKFEAEYYCQLKLKLAAGLIVKFDRQVPFKCDVNGKPVCIYKADFVVYYPDGACEVIETKGFKTDYYRLKKKIVEACFDFEIIEVLKK